MLILPALAIALLIYQTIASLKNAQHRNDERALRHSAARASDLEQWASIDPE